MISRHPEAQPMVPETDFLRNAETIGYVDLDGMSGPARNGAALVMFYLSEAGELGAQWPWEKRIGILFGWFRHIAQDPTPPIAFLGG